MHPIPLEANTAGSRSRPQARKKASDDAAYLGSVSGVGAKRQAIDKVEGEPRVKRKKVEQGNINAAAAATAGGGGVGVGKKAADKAGLTEAENLNMSLVEFKGMSTAMLYGYIAHFDLTPTVIPSPLSAEDPPPPFYLQDPNRCGSRAPTPLTNVTPANRPRRESKEQSRRRSSRLLDDEYRNRTPILTDVREFNQVLAAIAEKHFRETNVKEVDTLASFMCTVKAKVER